jgi:hypothetical protein
MIEEWNLKEYEFDKMCEICCEVYDPIEFLPKILPCCNKTFCLKCIKDNLKKQAKCMNCRTEFNFEEDQLITNENVFHLICPNCYRETEKSYLQASTSFKNFGKIMCDDCKEVPSEGMYSLLNKLANETIDLNKSTNFREPEEFKQSLKDKLERDYKCIIDALMSKLTKTFKEFLNESVNNLGELYVQNYYMYKNYYKLKKEKTETLKENLNKNINFALVNEYFQFYHKNKSRLFESFKSLKTDQDIIENSLINLKVPLDVLSSRIISNVQVCMKDQFMDIKDKEQEEFNLIELYSDNEEEDLLTQKISSFKEKFGILKIKNILDKLEIYQKPKGNLVESTEYHFNFIQSKYTKPKFIDDSKNPLFIIEALSPDSKSKPFKIEEDEEGKSISSDPLLDRYKPKLAQQNLYPNSKIEIRSLITNNLESEVNPYEKKESLIRPQTSSLTEKNKEKDYGERINYLTNHNDLRIINSEMSAIPSNNSNPFASNSKVIKSSVNINKYLKK